MGKFVFVINERAPFDDTVRLDAHARADRTRPRRRVGPIKVGCDFGARTDNCGRMVHRHGKGRGKEEIKRVLVGGSATLFPFSFPLPY